MPPALDRHQGSVNVVYVSAEEPDPITDPTEYEVLGMRTTANLNSNAPEITITDVHGTTTTFGPNAGTYSLAWNRSRLGDAGQTIIRAAHQANPKTPVWFLITSNVPGEKALTFKGTVGTYTRNDDNASPSVESVTVGLDGGFTETTITE